MRIGVDLGGTKIEVIALDESGKTLVRRRIATPAGDYRSILRAIKDLVSSTEKQLGQTGTVGVGTPGAISNSTGLMKNSNSVVLNGKPLSHDLAEELEREIRIENDANCFALSEAIDGVAEKARIVFAAILGTGVGAGLVVDKKVIVGRNRIAGEWGHNPLPWTAEKELQRRTCYCGKSGCVETFLSGAGLMHDYVAATGTQLSAEDISAAAASGDEKAVECLTGYQERLARGLASVINICDPDIVVLGGGLSNLSSIYPELPRLVERYAFTDRIETPIVSAKHGDSSGVRGAAWLWPAT